MHAPASSQRTTPWGTEPSAAVTLAVNVTGSPVCAVAGGAGETCTVVVGMVVTSRQQLKSWLDW